MLKNTITTILQITLSLALGLGIGFTLGSCHTIPVEKPMVIKYEYIPYPNHGNLLTFDPSTDLNTLNRITLIHENILLQSFIKKLIKRGDMIDYLYFNVDQTHPRYKDFNNIDSTDIKALKEKYRQMVSPLEATPDHVIYPSNITVIK